MGRLRRDGPRRRERLVEVGEGDDGVFDGRLVPGRLGEDHGPQVRLRVDRNQVRRPLEEELEGSVFFFGAKAGDQG